MKSRELFILDPRKVVVEFLPIPETRKVNGLHVPDSATGKPAIERYVTHPYRAKVLWVHSSVKEIPLGSILWLRNNFGDWVNIESKMYMNIDIGAIVFIEPTK